MPRRPGPSAAVVGQCHDMGPDELAATSYDEGRAARLTTCVQRHTFRATSALRIGVTRYPARKARDRLGADRCRMAVSTLSYRFGWPAKAAWRAGDRPLVCYSRTTS